MMFLGGLLSFWVAGPAYGAFPMEPAPDCRPENPAACPRDLGSWDEISWIPSNSVDSVREEELTMGAGVSLDRALRYTAGRWDVPIAILDSGVYWHRRRLLKKLYLNSAELPKPLLEDGSVAEDWDADGNGVFNIDDFQWDSRVSTEAGDLDGAGLLDPSDLIAVFSDGVDDDGNGYIDDISGWDFFAGDNNPYAELGEGYASHGTGVAEEAAESGDDGGTIGMCPNCAVIPVRIGDAFITDGRRISLAIHYAVDAGARSVSMATGGLTHNDSVREAVDYAESNRVVLVGAAGDENSYHHNFPAVENRILYVHSVRGDNQKEGSGNVRSYLNFLNCNNFGPRLDLVASSTACATGATAKIAGAAGLVISAGLEQGLDLSAGQVRTLLRASSDDVNVSTEDLKRLNTYPSREGWDAYYGYGRLNVGEAVSRVYAGNVGPEVNLAGPRWFTFHQDTVEVTGELDADEWTLYMGQGMEPDEWTVVTSGTGLVSGRISTADLSGLEPVSMEREVPYSILDRADRAHGPLVTFKVVATKDGLTAEDRVGFWVLDDPGLVAGWPRKMNASMEGSAQLVDLDGDGVFEIVVATSDGQIHALRGDGTPLDGFPLQTEIDPIFEGSSLAAPAFEVSNAIRQGLISAPAIGDLTGDGSVEIVALTLSGQVYAWTALGEILDGFPAEMVGRTREEMGPGLAWDNGFYANPALGDVDGDGDLEIVAGGGDQRLYVFDGDGAIWPGYPIELCGPGLCGEVGARIVSSPALGDIDGDGRLDAAIGTNEVPSGAAGLLYLVDLQYAQVWEDAPFGRAGLVNQGILPVLGEGHVASPALADMDGDGDLEIASAPMLGNASPIHHDGTDVLELDINLDRFGPLATFTDGSLIQMINNPAFADLDGDGVVDLLGGGASPMYLISLPMTRMMDHQHGLGVWSGAGGHYLPGYPQLNDDVAFLSSPAAADVSGDGQPEVIYSGGGHFIYASDAQGVQAPGFPHFTGGWSIGSPVVGDVTGDGYVEVVLGTRQGHLFVWATDGLADQAVAWSGTRHDPANTGNAHTPLVMQMGPPEGCCVKDRVSPVSAWLVLFPLGGWMVRRKRRA